MTHTVVKPFRDPRKDVVIQVGEPYKHEDASRIRELENAGIIAPIVEKEIAAAPFNKDAAKQRKTK